MSSLLTNESIQDEPGQQPLTFVDFQINRENSEMAYEKEIRPDVNVVKEGTVLKLAGFLVRSWKERWFKLRGQQLLYFQSKQDSQANPPRQILNIKGATILRAAEGKIASPTEYCIEIQLSDPPGKSYFFCVHSEEELEDWTKHLQVAAQLSFKEYVTIKSHDDDDKITTMEFSPSGKRLVTGTEKGKVKVWDMKLFKLLVTLDGHREKVTSCRFSLDPHSTSIFVTSSLDNALKIWDGAQYQLQTTIQGFKDGITHSVIAIDGKRIITGTSTGALKIWSMTTLQLLGSLSGHSGEFVNITLSSDGKRLVSASVDGTINFWNFPNHRSLATYQHPYHLVKCVIFGEIVVAADAEHKLYVWRWGQFAKPLATLEGHRNTVTGMCLSGGRLFTSSEDSTIHVWDLTTLQLLSQLKQFEQPIPGCHTSTDEKLLLGFAGNTVRIWDCSTLDTVGTLEHNVEVIDAMFTHNANNILCSLADHTFKIWSF